MGLSPESENIKSRN